MATAPIDPHTTVDPASRSPERRARRDGRRPDARPRQPVREEEDAKDAPPAPGRLDILA